MSVIRVVLHNNLILFGSPASTASRPTAVALTGHSFTTIMNNNPKGINGYGPKNCLLFLLWCFGLDFESIIDPDDKILSATLHQYAKEKLSTLQCLARLDTEFNLSIKFVSCPYFWKFSFLILNSPRASLLYKLNNRFNVSSSCKPSPEDIAMQAVLEKVAEDPLQGCGVGTIGVLLSNEGMPLPQ